MRIWKKECQESKTSTVKNIETKKLHLEITDKLLV